MELEFKKELFEFYKESYHFELERKDRLLQQVGLAIAILTITGNLIAYFLRDFIWMPFRELDLLFYSFFSIGGVFTAVSLYYVVRSLAHGYWYGNIPTPKEIHDTLEEFEAYNEKVSQEHQVNIENEFRDNLMRQYCDYTDRNEKNNTARYGFIFTGLRFAIFALVFLLLAFPGHMVIKSRFPNEVESIKLNEEVKIRIMPDQNQTQNTTQQQQTTSAQPAAEKPEWPQGRLTKEADEKNVTTRVINEDSKK